MTDTAKTWEPGEVCSDGWVQRLPAHLAVSIVFANGDTYCDECGHLLPDAEALP